MLTRKSVYLLSAIVAVTAASACTLLLDANSLDSQTNAVSREGGSGVDVFLVEGATIDGGCSIDLTTDTHNCGACGHDCGDDGCTGGLCNPIPIVKDQVSLFRTVLLGDRLYFTSHQSTTGYIASVARDAGPNTTPVILAPNLDSPRDLVTDGNVLYWTSDLTTGGGGVFRLPVDGGTSETVAINTCASALAIDAKNAYWTAPCATTGIEALVGNCPLVNGQNGIGCIGIAPLNNSLDGGMTMVSARGSLPTALAVDSTRIFFASKGSPVGTNNLVETAPLTGGTTTIFQPSSGSIGLAIADGPDGSIGRVYWTSPFGSVYTALKDATMVKSIATEANGGDVSLVTLYGNDLFFSDQTKGTLLTIPVGDTMNDAKVIAKLTPGIQGWSIDDNYIYVANAGANSIVRIHR